MMSATLGLLVQPLLGIMMPGPLELVIVGIIILLLFGKRLPELMGSLGRSVVEFKKGARESDEPDSRNPPLEG